MGLGLGTLSALGAGVTGFTAGMDDEQTRQNQEEDRVYQRGQRQRVLDQQARDDQLRKDNQSVPTERTTVAPDQGLPTGDAVGPSATPAPPLKTATVKVPQDQQLRSIADNFKKAGDIAKYTELSGQADKIGFARAAQQVNQLQAGAEGKSALQLATEAQNIFNSDPLPQQIKKITDDGKGGVIVTIAHNDTGQTVNVPYKDAAAVMSGIRAYYSPESFAAIQQAQLAARAKVQEEAAKEQAKPVTTPRGAITTFGAGDPRAKAGPVNNATGFGIPIGEDEDGNPIYAPGGRGGAGGAGTAGAGGKAGKGAADPVQEATKLLTDGMEKSGEKVGNPQLYTQALANLDGIYAANPKISPRTAAAVAYDAVADPTKTSLQINPKDGSVNQVYVNKKYDAGKPFNLGAGGGSVEEMEKTVGTDGMKKATVQMLGAQSNDETRAAIKQAASDPAYNKTIVDQIRAGSTPETVDANLAAWSNKVALVAKYGAGDKKPAAAGAKLGFGLGLPSSPAYTPDPTSPAGKSQAAQATARAAQAQKDSAKAEATAKLSAQFKTDMKALPPIDLARKYQDLRGDLPTEDAAALRAVEQKI